MRVLVTGGEHVGPLAVVRALRAAGHEPCALVPDRWAYAALSRATAAWRVSPDAGADPDGFFAAVRSFGVDAVLPGTEPALVVLSERRRELAPVLVGAPEPDLVARATDKALLPELAQAAGLETPATIEVARDDAGAAAREIGFPVIVKPVRSDVGDGTSLVHGVPHRADDVGALAEALAALPGERVLLQPFLDGALAAVCGVAWDGELVCSVQQQARRIWPAQAGISAFAETVARDPGLEEGVRRLLGELRWSGIFQTQFLRARDNAYLIDLNPRPYGSLALAVAAGLNLPAIWVGLLAGDRPRVGAYRVGVGYRSEEREAQAIVHLARSSPLAALHAARPRAHTTHAIAQLRDPLPAVSSLSKLVRRP